MESGGSGRDYDPKRLGRFGEDLAARWYVEHGYHVVDRNWRSTTGELDLIAARVTAAGDELVIVEVKTRSSLRFGAPVDAVGAAKQRRVRQLAAEWLAAHRVGPYAAVRFDVVAVIGRRVEVVEHAF
ncbi:MAG: YraN family protein [Actinomycetes bacterium]